MTSSSISWSFAVVKDTEGSVSMKYGSSYVICSIHGPKPITNSIFQLCPTNDNSLTDTGILTCSVRYASHISVKNQNDCLLCENVLRNSFDKVIRLDLYRKYNIAVNIVVIESSVKDICAMITCASLALLDAGIEMYDVITACHISFIKDNKDDSAIHGDQSINDDTKHNDVLIKENNIDMGITVAYASQLKEIAYIQMIGQLHVSQVVDVTTKLCEKCEDLRSLIENNIAS